MLSRAVLVLAVLSAALSAEVPETHIMHVPRHGLVQQQAPQGVATAPATTAAAPGAPQTPAEERSLKLVKAVPLLSKLALKPKFPFSLKEKLPFGLKKKLPAFLGGTAAAAAASGAAGAGGLGALGIHGLDFSKLSAHDAALLHQYPVWKVHRYNGIDLRPVRLGAPAASGPYPAAAPAGPYAAEEPKQVYGAPPKEVAVPEPVYGPPAETYGPPAETYGPPAETYGPPAETYGPPAQTYGPPAETYGPPAETYGPPAQTYGPPAQTYGPPAQTYGPPAETYGPPTGVSAQSAPAGDDGLEALSQLGALTDFLPGGGSGSGPFASLSNLGTLLSTSGRSKGEIFSTLTKLKQNFPDLIKSAVAPAPAPPAESAVYHPPAPSGIHGLIQGHPLFSKFANGFSGQAASHVPLPPLPELPTLPEIKGLREIPGIPALPHIKLPTKYIAQGGPYVSVRYPTQPSTISPRGQQLPIPGAPVNSFAPVASAPAAAPAVAFASAPAAAPAVSFASAPAPAPAVSFASAPAPAPAVSFASSPAVEVPAAPSATMLPPIRPADTYAVPNQAASSSSSVGPDNAIQQVTVPQTNFALPLEPQQPQQQQQYIYQVPVTQVQAQRAQAVNSYGVPVSQETYTYTTQQQQYAAPAQYSTPVTQYAAPTQYATPVTQYSAPTSQYGAPDAFVSASEQQSTSTDTEGRSQTQEQTEQDEERAEINPNSRSDHIDVAVDASEASEVRVPMPSGETRAVSSLVKTPAVSPVFNREEQARRLERLNEMRQMVDQMVDLSAYLDPAHPASTQQADAPVAEQPQQRSQQPEQEPQAASN